MSNWIYYQKRGLQQQQGPAKLPLRQFERWVQPYESCIVTRQCLISVVYLGNLHRYSDSYLSLLLHTALKCCTTLSDWVTAALNVYPSCRWGRQAGGTGGGRTQEDEMVQTEWNGRAAMLVVHEWWFLTLDPIKGRVSRTFRVMGQSRRRDPASLTRGTTHHPAHSPTDERPFHYNQYSDIGRSIEACQTEVRALLNVCINN